MFGLRRKKKRHLRKAHRESVTSFLIGDDPKQTGGPKSEKTAPPPEQDRTRPEQS